MNQDLLRFAVAVFTTVISLPVIRFVWRGGSFFGSFRQTVETMERYIEKLDQRVDDHETRLVRIESARETEQRYERDLGRRHHARRTGDPPPTDEREA